MSREHEGDTYETNMTGGNSGSGVSCVWLVGWLNVVAG